MEVTRNTASHAPIKGQADALFVRTLLAEIFTSGLLRLVFGGAWGIGLVMFIANALNAFDSILLLPFVCIGWLAVGLLVSLIAYSGAIRAYLGHSRTDPKVCAMFGARALSQREVALVRPILQQVAAKFGRSLPSFDAIYVIDAATPSMFSVGGMLFISSEGLRSRHLAGMLAHELGHYQNGDCHVFLALIRIVTLGQRQPQIEKRAWTTGAQSLAPNEPIDLIEKILQDKIFSSKSPALTGCLLFLPFVARSLMASGAGVRANTKAWAAYFQQQDFKADAFVAQSNLVASLLEYLEEVRFFDSATPYGLALQPPIESRIERLNHQILSRIQTSRLASTT